MKEEIKGEKLSEELLHQTEERYHSILDTMEDGYFEVDLAGNMTFCNQVNARLFGYAPAELIGRNNREYTDPENAISPLGARGFSLAFPGIHPS